MRVKSGRTRRVILISTVAAIGGFLFGFDTAVINGAVTAIQREFHASPVALGLAASAALVGSAAGAWYAGMVADRIGRVRTMQVAAVLFFASSLGAGLAVGRWTSAFCASLVASGSGSRASSRRRTSPRWPRLTSGGRLASLQQLAIVTGIFLALLSDFLIASIAGGSQHQFGFSARAWDPGVAAVPGRQGWRARG